MRNLRKLTSLLCRNIIDLRILPCTGRMRHVPSSRSLSLISEVNLFLPGSRTRISKAKVDGSFATNHRTSANQQKLGHNLVLIRMVGASRTIIHHSSLATSMPTPLRTSFAHASSALLQSVHCDSNSPIRLLSSHANRSRPIWGLRSVALSPRSTCFQRL